MFTREFAPIFRSLVELPANVATNVYAKQLGTELAYLYREQALDEPARVISVAELLGRASLTREALAMRKRRRVSEFVARFEETMDALKSYGVHEGWCYAPDSEAELRAAEGQRTYFDTWLAATLLVTPPREVLASFGALARRASERWPSGTKPGRKSSSSA